jgi:hypothetical protein
VASPTPLKTIVVPGMAVPVAPFEKQLMDTGKNVKEPGTKLNNNPAKVYGEPAKTKTI